MKRIYYEKFDVEVMFSPNKLALVIILDFNIKNVPSEVWESIAELIYPQVVEFFENEENQKAYELWLKQQCDK